MGVKTNLLPSMKVHCKVIGLDCMIILQQLNRLKAIKPMKRINNLSFHNMLPHIRFLNFLKRDINKQVLETKYTVKLGQLLWAILEIKRYVLTQYHQNLIYQNW
jgi:hypothetical protein